MALANGLISALPQLLAQAPVIISNLVTAVVQAAPQLLSAALELVVTLASGIIDNLGQIFSAAGEIVSTVWDGVTSLVSTIWDIGSNIVEGIWQGISNGFEWIKGKISGWITDVLDFFKSMLGIASPSKVFSGYGLMLAEGLGLGIEDGIGDVESAMGDMSDAAIAAWKADQLSTSLTGTAAYQFSGPNAAMLGGASESADIMSAIFAVGNMIVEAVNNQDSGVYLDGAAVAESLYQHNQDVQLRHGATMII
jgi:phage-related protein